MGPVGPDRGRHPIDSGDSPQKHSCTHPPNAPLGGAPSSEGDWSWPLSDLSLSDSYGPRTQSYGYGFHRGLDLEAPMGTEVLAAADGEVIRAGEDDSYDEPVVQLAHASDGEMFYTNYMHLSGWLVEVGDQVSRGQPVGLTGASASNPEHEHLHFELRVGDDGKEYAAHPLRRLPYIDSTPPAILDAERGDGIAFAIELPGCQPDLERVEVAVLDPATRAPVASRSYDMAEVNLARLDDGDAVDEADYEGYVLISPLEFDEESELYRVHFSFYDLDVGDAPARIRATDARGESVELTLE